MDFEFLYQADLVLWVILFIGTGLFVYLYKILFNEKWYQLLISYRIIIFFYSRHYVVESSYNLFR